MTTAHQQLAIGQRRKLALEQAEAERIEKQSEGQRAIEAQDAENARLTAAAQADDEISMRHAVQQAAAVNAEAINAMFARLDDIAAQLKAVSVSIAPEAKRVDLTRQAAEQRAAELAHIVHSQVSAHAYASLPALEASLGAMAKARIDNFEIPDAYTSRMGTLETGMDAESALAVWINQAVGQTDRALRQRTAFLITGKLLDPPAGFQPDRFFKTYAR